jgi:hypothetical protein
MRYERHCSDRILPLRLKLYRGFSHILLISSRRDRDSLDDGGGGTILNVPVNEEDGNAKK